MTILSSFFPVFLFTGLLSSCIPSTLTSPLSLNGMLAYVFFPLISRVYCHVQLWFLINV